MPIDTNQLNELLEIIEYADEDIVYLSGSLIEGFGNKNSDIDVYVIKKESRKLQNTNELTSETKFVFSEYGERAVDIEYWECSTVANIIKEINSFDFSDKEMRVGQSINTSQISFIHRLIHGRPIKNTTHFRELVARINLEKYFKIGTRSKINEVDNLYEDVVGNYEANEYLTSYLLCNAFTTKCVYAYLLSKEVFVDRDKWVLKKMEKLAQKDEEAHRLLEKYKKVTIYNGISTLEDIKINIEASVSLVNLIVEIIQNKGDGI